MPVGVYELIAKFCKFLDEIVAGYLPTPASG